MIEEYEFPHLKAAASKLGGTRELSRTQLRELICHDCEFWHEDHEEELECSCFRILKILLSRGELSPDSLARLISIDDPDR